MPSSTCDDRPGTASAPKWTRTNRMQFWLFLHVLSAIIAFGPLFTQALVGRDNPGAGASFAKAGTFIQAPALAVLLLTGIVTAATLPGDGIMGQTWISVAFVVWVAMAVVLYLLISAHRNGSAAVQGLTGVMHLLLVVSLVLMIWQPGS